MADFPDLFRIIPVDDAGRLFISPAIAEWSPLAESGIDVVIDLEGAMDTCIPTRTNNCHYIYFPIPDDNEEEPPMVRLRAIARLGASLIQQGHGVLAHCGLGFNRSALVAGLILIELGMPGPAVVERLRERRPGALFNDKFAEVLTALNATVETL
jgi:protein-tyrosine phosphatase